MDKKLSFSISSKSSSSNHQQTLKPSDLFSDDDDLDNGGENSCHYITEFNDGSSTEIPKLVIPPIQNQFWPAKMTESLNLPSRSASAVASGAEIHEGLNIRQSRIPIDGDGDGAADQGPKELIDGIMYGLNIRQSRTPSNGNGAPDEGSKDSIDSVMLKKLKADLDSLPDDEGSQQFDEVPVEGFGAALMAGYGWKEGMGIGRNVDHDVEVVKFKPWNGRQGLGARIDS